MHFSRPSGQRLSWCLPWNRGAVGSFCSGYWTVSTFLNICRKVTPNPLTGFRKSNTGDLLDGAAGLDGGVPGHRTGAGAVVVRQVHGRYREAVLGLPGLVGLVLRLRRAGLAMRRRVEGPDQQHQHDDDGAGDKVDRDAAALTVVDAEGRDDQRPGQRGPD